MCLEIRLFSDDFLSHQMPWMDLRFDDADGMCCFSFGLVTASKKNLLLQDLMNAINPIPDLFLGMISHIYWMFNGTSVHQA